MSKLHIEITFPIEPPGAPSIHTDVKQERVVDLLVDWLRATQFGHGEDTRKAAELDVYHISIDVDLADDSFMTKTDTNNSGLTCGIVMDVIGKITAKKVVWK